MSRPPVPRLLAISDRHCLGPDTFDGWLDALADAGVDGVQLREKDLPDRELYERACRMRARLPERVAVLVNGRLDIALAAGCQGVHLPVTGLPADALRAWARERGAEVVIGRSTHGVDEVRGAREEGADYVTFGPVFSTPSKEGYGPPVGLDALREVARPGLPVLALGGIDPSRVDAVAEAGASGLAGIRGFHDRGSLEALSAVARRSFGTNQHGRFRHDA